MYAALEQVDVGLEVYDADGYAMWMNDAMVRFLGLPSAESVLGKFNILTDPFSKETGLLPVYERAYAGEVVVSEEFAIDMERASETWGSDARAIWFRMILVPHVDEQGAVRSVFAIMQETTQERQMQRTLRLAQQREGLELLAGGVAHDFNNLLTAVLGQASLLEAGIVEGDEAAQCGREIVNAAKQAASLTAQLLAYAGRGRGELLPTDLRNLIRETAHLVRVTFAKTASLELDLGERPAVALVDNAQLKQVLMNLVTNAYQALPEGVGTVRVSTRVADVDDTTLRRVRSREPLVAGTYVLLDVVDDGCGMVPKTLERIFEPYFTTKQEGHGLGLAATLGTVTGHRGGVLVDSSPGEGTRFCVLLPLCDVEPIAPRIAASPRRDNSGLVLVADDEPYIRSLVSQILERTGYSVVEADDGRRAIALLDEHGAAVEMVLIDVMMPGANGLDALEAIRRRSSSLPVVLMSGHSDAGEAATRGDHNTWFLPKPFGVEAVLDILDRASDRASCSP
ncbi:MAG: response regulator [Myxococcota bacterium]